LTDDIIEVIRPQRSGVPKPRWVIILEENLAENKSYERQRIQSFTASDWRKLYLLPLFQVELIVHDFRLLLNESMAVWAKRLSGHWQ